ncbi:hypothetical protein J6590_013489 [Homalodisca vitripennis]|nr:hypothetical protein J6590_013489 [Homalodisca vitripennis]
MIKCYDGHHRNEENIINTPPTLTNDQLHSASSVVWNNMLTHQRDIISHPNWNLLDRGGDCGRNVAYRIIGGKNARVCDSFNRIRSRVIVSFGGPGKRYRPDPVMSRHRALVAPPPPPHEYSIYNI